MFVGLGTPGSSALDVSDDGSVVVGQLSTPPTSQPFRWQNGVTTGLGWLGTSSGQGNARAVSADGSVVVGSTTSSAANTPDAFLEPFRWENGVMSGLGFLDPVQRGGQALGVSADGSIVIGWSFTAESAHAFRWQGGVMLDLGVLDGAIESQAWAVSGNGSVVVGESSSPGTTEAFRWESGVMTGLGFLDGATSSWAFGVSDDGVATVGASEFEAFLWMDGVMIGLGTLDGHFDSTAYAASNGGAIVVGASGEFLESSAFIWNSVDGMQNLQEVLSTTYGLEEQLAGWNLRGARGISPDGRIIVGYGTNPAGLREGWLAIIPEPSSALLLALGLAGLATRRARSQPT
jgi:probable HAF family extracellular repeat protein